MNGSIIQSPLFTHLLALIIGVTIGVIVTAWTRDNKCRECLAYRKFMADCAKREQTRLEQLHELLGKQR